MRRQPPIARCFAALCLGSGIALAAFEWRHPFPEAVVTLDAAPDMDTASSNLLPTASLEGRNSKIWPFSKLSAEAKQTTAVEAAPVELALSLESRTLEMRVPGEPPVVYEVAVGQADWQTPTGEFVVLNKLENPAWQHPLTKEEIPPGPENPLGSHWIGFWTDGQAQIGFHGTNQEELIGEAVSHGCVRMKNADIAELYALVRVGTVVTVQP